MLFEVFNSVGPVTSIRVCRDSVTRRSLGYAYVNYQTLQDAERSLDALNYTLIRGQPCRIMWSQRDPSLRKSGSGNVFVKNLDRSIDNKALYDTFSLFGNILSCKVGVDEANRSKGYGFVHYESEASARNAIEKVNGMLIGGKTVYVGPFVTRAEREHAGGARFTNVYLKNLPRCWGAPEALSPVLQPYGEITSLLVKQDPKGRFFAFCNFADHAAAKACVQALNGRIVNSEGFKDGPPANPAAAAAAAAAAGGDAAAAAAAGGSQGAASQGEGGGEGGGSAAAAGGGQQGKDGAAAAAGSSNGSSSSSNGSANGNAAAAAEGGAAEEGSNSSNNNNSSNISSSSSSDEMVLFVGPHQTRAQRTAALRMKYEQQQQERGDRYRGVNLYVKNLDDSVDDAKLRELFEPFGPTSSVKVMRDEKGVSKGFGFVCFSSPDDASKAVAEMHLKYINGKPLYTGLAERRDQRQQRLQQRFRMPQLRQGAAAAVPGHVGYPAAAAAAAAAALPGVAAYQQRAMMYPAQSHMVLPWAGRQQQQQQQLQQGLALQRGIPPAALQHIYAPQSAVAAAAALQVSLQQQQQQQQPMMQQQRGGAAGHRAARGGAAGSAKQQQQQLLKQQQQLPGGGSFKFTPQVRNPRVDQQQQQQQPPPPLHVQQQQQQQQQPPLEAAHVLLSPEAPLTAAALAAAQPSMQKQMLGERLFPLIARHQPELAGKITGMMLEMDNSELLILLESENQLKNKIEEALGVLRGAN
ncbi:polyadenylate-binding protein, putative [Eimeria brunetti]|uniref:Polyadenylate-binding protein n=1 Tax=Eimeria brunetti TaxID=51314 RepID=U6LUY5_9EIME|nr:polyadenylate-binding protein, putative [Eimeria brunetti]